MKNSGRPTARSRKRPACGYDVDSGADAVHDEHDAAGRCGAGRLNSWNRCTAMSLLDTLERKLGRFAVPHVTLGLIACQVIVYLANLLQQRPDAGEPFAERFWLIPQKVLAGEVWRLVTFLVVPPFGFILWTLFFWYLFYLMGTALERTWGTFRYNVFLLLGYVATVATSFILLDEPASNAFLPGSVFLAFAYLSPAFQLYILFFLPVTF